MPGSVYLFILLQTIIVATIDLKTRKISNSWSLFNIIFYFLGIFFLSTTYMFSWESWAFPVGIFILGFGLYYLKIMGGGDSKFMATIFVVIPPAYHEQLAMNLIMTTIVCAGAIFLFNFFRNVKKIKNAVLLNELFLLKGIWGKKFPFAPIISLSVGLLGWQQRSLFFY